INYEGNAYSMYSGAGINHTFEMENQKLTMDLSLFANFRQEPFLINGQDGVANNQGIGTSISFNYNLHDIVDFAPRYYVYRSASTSGALNYPYVDLWNHRLSGEFTFPLPWDMEVQNDLTYQYLPNPIPGFRNSNLMWNAALNKKLLKSKKLT